MDSGIRNDISLADVAKPLLASIGIGFEMTEDNESKDEDDGFVRPTIFRHRRPETGYLCSQFATHL